MAVHNPAGLYTGGQGIFNSMPYTQLALQQEAKKQAKAEALNQYFSNLRGKINEAGARTIDLGGDGKNKGILDEISDWENHWKKNKDNIQRGGAARQESDNMYAAIQRQVEKSKGRAKFQLEMGKGVAEGKFDPDEEDMQGAMTHVGKSIYDPTSYKDDGVSEYGWGDLSPAIPEYDVEKKSKVFEAISKGIDPGKKYDYSKMTTNPITGQAVVPFTEARTPEQVKKIGEMARYVTEGNSPTAKSARKHYNKILNNSEYLPELEALDNAYKTVHGKDAFVSTPGQAAEAEAILRASIPKKDAEEQEINYAQRQQAAINKIYIQDGLIRGRSGGSGSGSQPTIEGNEFDRIPIPKKGLFGKNDTVEPKDIPSITKAILKTSGVDVEGMKYFKITVGDDGKIETITPYWQDKDNKIHQDGVITRRDMENAQLKYNAEPQKGQQPVFGDKTNQQSRPPKDIKKTKMTTKKGELD